MGLGVLDSPLEKVERERGAVQNCPVKAITQETAGRRKASVHSEIFWSCGRELSGLIASFLVQLAFPFRIGLPAATAIIAFAIGLAAGATSGAYETTFYESTSQVIPVLLLVLAVEARFFRIDLVPFKQLRESFVTELTEELGESPSSKDVLRAALALQRGQSFAYVQQRLVMVLALLTLVAGEVASIVVLGQPNLESSALQGLVLGATFAGLGAVMIAALVGPMPLVDQPSSVDTRTVEEGEDTPPVPQRGSKSSGC